MAEALQANPSQMRLARTILVTASMYLLTHLFVFAALPVLILISYLDGRRIPDLKRWFVRCLFAIVGKDLEVTGTDYVRPDQSYVIISNYPSFYASFALIGTFPRASVVAHAFTRKVPLLGQVLRRLGTIFVRPGKAGQGMRAIDLGLGRQAVTPSIIILPEGARTVDGKIHAFRKGFIRILRQTSLDLLPVTLNGLYSLKPVKRFYADPEARPELVIHSPIGNSAARQMTDDELLGMAQAVIGDRYRP